MAIGDRITQPADWELQYRFEDEGGEAVSCDRDKCSIGSYIVSGLGRSTLLIAPACVTCEFAGGLGDVFNDQEERFEPGAPECFKKAAARILTGMSYSPIGAIRTGRPDTAAMIDQYASTEL